MQTLSVSLPHKSTFFYTILGLSASFTCILLLSSILHQQLQIEELDFPKIDVQLPKIPIETTPLVLLKPVMLKEPPPLSNPKTTPSLPTQPSKPTKPARSTATRKSSSRPTLSPSIGIVSLSNEPKTAPSSIVSSHNEPSAENKSSSTENDSSSTENDSSSTDEVTTEPSHSHESSKTQPALLKPKVLPAILIRKEKISTNDDPHLPESLKAQRRHSRVAGTYKLCIAVNGSISSVDVIVSIPGGDEHIIQTLKGWRYRPQGIPICFIQHFEFEIE